MNECETKSNRNKRNRRMLTNHGRLDDIGQKRKTCGQNLEHGCD